MTDREFAQLAESIKRMESQIEEFAAKLLAAQDRMIRALEQMEEQRRLTVRMNVDVPPLTVFTPGGKAFKAGRMLDAVGGLGCKASVETLRT